MMCKDLNTEAKSWYYAPEQIDRRRKELRRKLEQLDAQYLEEMEKRQVLARARLRARDNRYGRVARLVEHGVTFAEIGRKLGITRAGARCIFIEGQKRKQNEDQNKNSK